MPLGDNPAARLDWFIKNLFGRPAETGIVPAIEMIYGLETGRVDLVMQHIAGIAQLTRETRQLIDAIPKDDPRGPDVTFKPFNQVEGAVASLMNPGGVNIGGFLRDLTDRGVYCVEVAAVQLVRANSSVSEQQEKTVADLIEQISKLKAEVLNDFSDLAPSEQGWILGQLDVIEQALRNYHLYGDFGVQTARDQVIGAATMTTPGPGGGHTSGWKRARMKVGAAVFMLEALLSIGVNAPALMAGDSSQANPVIVQIFDGPAELTSGAPSERPSDDSQSQPPEQAPESTPPP